MNREVSDNRIKIFHVFEKDSMVCYARVYFSYVRYIICFVIIPYTYNHLLVFIKVIIQSPKIKIYNENGNLSGTKVNLMFIACS